MMIRCLFVAAALCVGAKWAIAREPTDGEKMMIAAGIIISTAYPVPGAHVNVVNEDEAEVTSLMDQRGDKIRNIKKIEDCVYAMTVPTSGGEDGYEIIDFKRLSGEWRHSGEEMYFVGEKNAACFRNSEMGRSGCSAGVLMPYTNAENRAQVVDDLNYLQRHGCGGGDPDPH